MTQQKAIKKAWVLPGILSLIVILGQFQYTRLLQSFAEVQWDLRDFHAGNQRDPKATLQSVSGATGALYTMKRIRTYVNTETNPPIETLKAPLMDHHTGVKFPISEAWAVVTTINPPTKTLELLAQVPGLRLCVVADRKSPGNYSLPGVVYLTPDMQVGKEST